MGNPIPNITIPVDLTNPGQFFACCGLLELADRLWPGAEGWFADDMFHLIGPQPMNFTSLMDLVIQSRVLNTMTPAEVARLEALSRMTKKEREKSPNLENEKSALEARYREESIVLDGKIRLPIDWFKDDSAGGSNFKTWAGRQSVLAITQDMHRGLASIPELSESTIWYNARGTGLPFNFDSDLGAQGSALDIGFSFDPLAGSEATRIEGTCKPALEFLCFIGLQRFRPQKMNGENRFVYTAWNSPLSPCVAAAAASRAIQFPAAPSYEFRLLYRTKYLKSFLTALTFQGARHE